MNAHISKFISNIIAMTIPNGHLRHRVRSCIKHYLTADNEYILINPDGSIKRNPRIKGLKVKFLGDKSRLVLHAPIKFKNSLIVLGNHNKVVLNKTKYCYMNFQFVTEPMADYSKLIIGKDFSCVGTKIFLHDEPYNQITIGDDCMFSFDIILWPSDGHTIFNNETRHVINMGGGNKYW